jgi:hypothetical protein
MHEKIKQMPGYPSRRPGAGIRPRTDGCLHPILCDTPHHQVLCPGGFEVCLPKGQQRTWMGHNERDPREYRVIVVPTQLQWMMR